MGNIFENRNHIKIILIMGLMFMIIVSTLIISNMIVKWATKSDYEINFPGGDSSNNLIAATDNSKEEKQEDEGEVKKITAVIIGLDKSKNLSDVVMVVQFNPKENSLKCVSIPRDLYIDFSDYKFSSIRGSYQVNVSYCKLTEVYQNVTDKEDAVKVTQEIAEKIVGIPIDYYVKVDLDGFKAIVDLVGGIEVEVPKRMVYHDQSQGLHISLESGLQTLDGEKAEQLVRYRSGYVDGDLGRIKMQQEVLKALCKKVLEIRNPIEIFSLVKEGYQYIETDFSLLDCMKYIEYITGLNVSTIFQEGNMVTIPTYGEKINGLWYEMQDKDKTREILEELFNQKDQ